MNYRKLYTDLVGEIPKDDKNVPYEIHHIDGNHNNNAIENLIAVSIQEHYDIHYSQGNYNACYLISTRLHMTNEKREHLKDLCSKFMTTNNPSSKSKGANHPSRNTAVVRNSNTNETIRISRNDPRFLMDEWNSVNKNMVTVRDRNGKCFSVKLDDPRYISGELIPASKGKTRNWSEDQVSELYKSRIGRKWSEEERLSRDETRKPNPNKGKPGNPQSVESNHKRSDAARGKIYKLVTCPHCGKIGGGNAMKQHHFDRCKEKSFE
jgi:hypothetical protein